jgi:hypothetical protein
VFKIKKLQKNGEGIKKEDRKKGAKYIWKEGIRYNSV